MSVLTTLGVFNYGLVLLYGLFLSTFISGGWENTKQRTLVFAACPLFLMIQSVCWLALGAAWSWTASRDAWRGSSTRSSLTCRWRSS